MPSFGSTVDIESHSMVKAGSRWDGMEGIRAVAWKMPRRGLAISGEGSPQHRRHYLPANLPYRARMPSL